MKSSQIFSRPAVPVGGVVYVPNNISGVQTLTDGAAEYVRTGSAVAYDADKHATALSIGLVKSDAIRGIIVPDGRWYYPALGKYCGYLTLESGGYRFMVSGTEAISDDDITLANGPTPALSPSNMSNPVRHKGNFIWAEQTNSSSRLILHYTNDGFTYRKLEAVSPSTYSSGNVTVLAANNETMMMSCRTGAATWSLSGLSFDSDSQSLSVETTVFAPTTGTIDLLTSPDGIAAIAVGGIAGSNAAAFYRNGSGWAAVTTGTVFPSSGTYLTGAWVPSLYSFVLADTASNVVVWGPVAPIAAGGAYTTGAAGAAQRVIATNTGVYVGGATTSATSTDGATWVAMTTSPHTAAGGVIAQTSDSVSNGTALVKIGSNEKAITNLWVWRDCLLFGGSLYLAGGLSTFDGVIHRANADLSNFELVFAKAGIKSFQTLSVANGYLIATGRDGSIAWTSDGATWSSTTIAAASGSTAGYKVRYVGTTYVFFTQDNSTGSYYTASSLAGPWTTRRPYAASGISSGTNGTTLVVPWTDGAGVLRYSTDAINWTGVTGYTSTQGRQMIYEPTLEQFVLFGSTSVSTSCPFHTSVDGITFALETTLTTTKPHAFTKLSYLNTTLKHYLCSPSTDAIFESSNGLDGPWTEVSLPDIPLGLFTVADGANAGAQFTEVSAGVNDMVAVYPRATFLFGGSEWRSVGTPYRIAQGDTLAFVRTA